MNRGRPHRLAMVTPFPINSDHVQGGVECVALTLIKGLQELDIFDIHVISPAQVSNRRIENRNGITIHWLPLGKLPGVLRYWTTERKAIHRCLEEIEPDITHFQGVIGWSIGYKRPYVVTIHGIAEKDALYSSARFPKLRYSIIAIIERFARKKARHVISINPYVQAELKHDLKGNIWNIENPVDESFFKTSRQLEQKNIFYVGRIIERKNILGLIRAFSEFASKAKDINLIIAGSSDTSEYKQECSEYIQRLDISDRVIFLGNIGRDELPQKLAGASCFILLSHQETAPMAIEEAMAVGIPVVASDICGIPYMVEDGSTGFLVDPNDPSQAAIALEKIFLDNELATAMGNYAKKVAMNRFHYRNVANKTVDVYLAALGSYPNSVCN